MKNIVSLLLALALALPLSAPAMAAQQHMSNFVPTASAGRYSDVWSGAWYADAAALCREYGLMQGSAAGRFNPTGTLSVAEALVIADRIHEIYTTGKSTLKSGWNDQWYQPYVDYAVQNGIMDAGDFDSYTRPATRAEVAYLFADALPPAELHAINDIDHLSDVPRGKYYNSVLLLYNAGVLTGSGADCRFRPDDTITRAEIAAVASRMILPRERMEFLMLDAQDLSGTVSGLTVYMPGTLETRAEDSAARFATVTNEAGLYRCEVSAAAYATLDPARDITQLSKTEAKNAMAAALTAAGYRVDIASVRAVDAAFGDVAAYRYEFRADDAGDAEHLCFGYVFVRGGALCTVTYLTVRDSTEFRAAIAAPALDGAAVRIL